MNQKSNWRVEMDMLLVQILNNFCLEMKIWGCLFFEKEFNECIIKPLQVSGTTIWNFKDSKSYLAE